MRRSGETRILLARPNSRHLDRRRAVCAVAERPLYLLLCLPLLLPLPLHLLFFLFIPAGSLLLYFLFVIPGGNLRLHIATPFLGRCPRLG